MVRNSHKVYWRALTVDFSVFILPTISKLAQTTSVTLFASTFFRRRLKISDPNPSAKDYPKDITTIVGFLSFHFRLDIWRDIPVSLPQISSSSYTYPSIQQQILFPYIEDSFQHFLRNSPKKLEVLKLRVYCDSEYIAFSNIFLLECEKITRFIGYKVATGEMSRE